MRVAMCQIDTTVHSLASWRTAVGDTTSTAQAFAFSEPTATIGTYNSTAAPVGAATLEAFLQAARQQSKANWEPKYSGTAAVQFFQAAFDIVVP